MKKRSALIFMILLTAFLYGCEKITPAATTSYASNTNAGSRTSAAMEPLNLNDYFPVRQNVRYTYKGVGNEYASYVVTVDYASDTRVQQRTDNGGTVAVKVLERKDGKLTRILSSGETYYRENMLVKKGTAEEVLLMEPLKVGTSWTLSDGGVRTITGISASVETPLGNYKAIEVTTEGQSGKAIEYYVKDIGFVKSVFISGGNQITSSLVKIEENVPYTQKVSFYYPNINDQKIYYKDQDVSFHTNDSTSDVLASYYKETVNKNYGKVISENVKINSLYLDDDKIVHIDFGQAFLTEMNAGSGYESMILQCIANTFGKYYNTDKVILTVNGKLYESGHIAFKKGEYIKTNFQNTVKITQ